MAEEQKNVEVPKDIKTEETAPAVAAATADEPTKDAIVTDAPTAPEEPKLVGAEEPKSEEAKPADGEEAKADEKAEEKKEEAKPIEEGQLGHKAQGASFPKNLIGSKEFFFFGTDAFEKDALASYSKHEKNITTAHANVAWATETGKGLLFSGDKKAPTGIINLSDASEPENEGANKFVLTSKGNKHSFKAANGAERDNWVAQIKAKIAEAKELAPTVTESEKYKATIESYKPKPIAKKEETSAAAATAEAPKEETTEEAKPEEPVKDEAAKEETKSEEAKPEEAKKAESPKPLKSKRASFFGFLDKKEKPEEKKEEAKVEEPAKTEETPAVAAEADKSADAPTAPEEPKLVGAEEPKTEEAKPEEPKAESPKDKASKRNSFFGGILSKKEKKAAEPKAEEKKEETAEEPKTEEAAPVIPPVEATTPLAVDVNNTASTPAAETAESPAAATNGEKKDTKEKRKSSLPFLGKREKSPAPAEGEDKDKSSKSAFSKIRATIKGKSAPKEEKKEEIPKEEVKEEETPKVEDKKEDEVAAEPAKAEPVKDDAAKPVDAETENKPEAVAAPTPAVTAAA